MAELMVRDIDDQLMQVIELRAKTTGQSVQEFARELLELGLKVDAKGRVAVSDHIRAMQPAPVKDDSTDLIRRMRDAR